MKDNYFISQQCHSSIQIPKISILQKADATWVHKYFLILLHLLVAIEQNWPRVLAIGRNHCPIGRGGFRRGALDHHTNQE